MWSVGSKSIRGRLFHCSDLTWSFSVQVAPAPSPPPKTSHGPPRTHPVPDTAYISPQQMAAIPEDQSVISQKGPNEIRPAGPMFSLEAVGGQGRGAAAPNNAVPSSIAAAPGGARGSDGFRTSEGTPLALLHVQRSLKLQADFANSPTPSGRHGTPARTPSRRSIETRRNSVGERRSSA